MYANVPLAMSRRIATDTGGRRGPQSSRQPDRGETQDRPNSRSNNNNNMMGNNSANGMPMMPFNFPGMPNGMMFPPGFFQNFPQQQGNDQQR